MTKEGIAGMKFFMVDQVSRRGLYLDLPIKTKSLLQNTLQTKETFASLPPPQLKLSHSQRSISLPHAMIEP